MHNKSLNTGLNWLCVNTENYHTIISRILGSLQGGHCKLYSWLDFYVVLGHQVIVPAHITQQGR